MSELNIPADFVGQTIEGLFNRSVAIDYIETASSEAKAVVNAFMSDMQQYIRYNKTPEKPFCSTVGLCCNLETRALFLPNNLYSEIMLLFKNVLKASFGENKIPFNTCWSDYNIERAENTRYLNPLRLSFIENWKPL